MSDKWVRASEISNFVYCRRAWWMQRMEGHTSNNVRELQQGTRFHQKHNNIWLRSLWGQRLAYALVFVFVAFVTFQLLMSTQ